MQKWEYCCLYWYPFRLRMLGEQEEVRIGHEKAKGDRTSTDAAYRVIAELGLQGWEMVCGDSLLNAAKIEGQVWFKRCISGDQG